MSTQRIAMLSMWRWTERQRKKIARLAKMDQAFAHRSPNSPAPRPTRIGGDLAEKKSEPKKRRIIPCIDRGQYVGTLDCACDGARDTYRCTKIDRPGHPGEKAFCMGNLTSKPYSRIVDPKTKLILNRVANGEVILCKPPFTIDMNGSEHHLGCSIYSPTNSERA